MRPVRSSLHDRNVISTICRRRFHCISWPKFVESWDNRDTRIPRGFDKGRRTCISRLFVYGYIDHSRTDQEASIAPSLVSFDDFRGYRLSIKQILFRLKETEKLDKRTNFFKAHLLENAPHAHFIFKYRPKGSLCCIFNVLELIIRPFPEFLLSQGIIPGLEDETGAQDRISKSNSPAPKSKKRKRTDTTDKENDENETARRREALVKEASVSLYRLDMIFKPDSSFW